jgi:hypothetical protein
MKGKRKLIIKLCFCILFINAKAQLNLVPNNSFENSPNCPYVSGIFFPSVWYGSGGSPDYYNTCDTSPHQGVPINKFGHQYAHSGDAYVGLAAYIQPFFGREYIGVQLISILNAGQTYYVNYYVSLADTALYAIKNVGALFTNTVYNPPGSSVSTIPQIENTSGIITDKNNWVQISGSFIAVGGEKYITIGNFRNDTTTVKQYVGNGWVNSPIAYYYIDDVYVGETPLVVGDVLGIISDKLKVFPNPANGVLVIESELPTSVININDVLGKQVKQIKTDTKKTTIDISELHNGIYFIKVINKEEGIEVVRKFVKE